MTWANCSTKSCRLLSMLAMTASFFLVEIIVGYITNSIALVADSFHMLSDVVALIVGLASVRISKWETSQNTFGWVRAEVVGAMVNSVFLLALCFSITVESLKRLVDLEKVEDPKLMLIVGAVGLLVNLIGICLFGSHAHSHGGGGSSHGHSHGGGGSHNHDTPPPPHETRSLVIAGQDGDGTALPVIDCDSDNSSKSNKISSSEQLNMRGVFLHVLGDALGSVIVIISALVIWFETGEWRFYVDPALSLALVAIILTTTIPLLRESALILLQTVPTHIDIPGIRKELEKLRGVNAIHEFHVWQLAGNRIIASAHINCQDEHEYMVLAGKVKEIFHNSGIHSTTIQPEFVQTQPSLRDCALECGPDKVCHPNTCCVERPSKSSKSSLSKRKSSTDEEPVESV